MRRLLLTAAGSFVALTASLTMMAAPAAALDRPGPGSSFAGVKVHRGSAELKQAAQCLSAELLMLCERWKRIHHDY